MSKQDSAPAFYVDDNTVTPAMGMYLDSVKEKIKQSGMRGWPKDRSGREMLGEVVVQITLQKNGYIKDIRAVPIPGYSDDSNDALSESVILLVKGVQPFPPFSPSMFSGYELVTFDTTVSSAQGARPQTAKPRAGAQGNNQRLEMRTRIPF